LSKTASTIEEINFEGIRVTLVQELFEIASCNVSVKEFRTFRELCECADLVHFNFSWPFGDVLRMLVPKDTKQWLPTAQTLFARNHFSNYILN
jgi:hypothetical protein